MSIGSHEQFSIYCLDNEDIAKCLFHFNYMNGIKLLIPIYM